ncbi:MAG: TPM domain-containing protein [Akkermansiaceae bacterium]|nr:TPM domain-containing protein [Akkermansiaceae bacterium]
MSRMIKDMQCPYCQAKLTESAIECNYCNLSLKSANALLGPIPQLSSGINDFDATLDKKSQKKINKSLSKLAERFPQVRMHVIINKFDPKYSLSTHLFWLFNQDSLSTSNRKGGKNHTVLLGLDSGRSCCALMVGYGLEPFLARKALDHVLDKAQPSLSQGDYKDAILIIIDELTQLMQETCKQLEDVLDISEAETYQPIEY